MAGLQRLIFSRLRWQPSYLPSPLVDIFGRRSMRSGIRFINTRGSDSRSMRSWLIQSTPTSHEMPLFLSSRKEFSNAPQKNPSQGPASTQKTSPSGNYRSKLALGTVVIGGAAVMTAYQTGYIDFPVKNEKPSVNSNKLDAVETLELEHPVEQVILPSKKQESKLNPVMETVEENDEPHNRKELEINREVVSEVTPSEEQPVPAPVKENDEPHDHKELEINREVVSEVTPSEEEPVPAPVKENELSSFLQESTSTPDEQTIDSKLSSDDTLNDGINSSASVSEGSDTSEAASHHGTSMEPEDLLGNESKAQKSLVHSYSLQLDEAITEVSEEGETTDTSSTSLKDKETSVVTTGNSVVTTMNFKAKNESEDGKIVLDFIEAIDAAKRKQAESDAYVFAEEKRRIKEKYEKELKDARARELMYAEEAAILDKELNKEKAKAATAAKLLQEKAEQNLLEELQRKEEEAAIELKKVQELAKAQLAAAIASEKSSQIEKIAEANLHVNALCMAFHARSEEARQTHSVHKLALGTLALEDALSKGLPIRAEVDALRKSIEGIDRDSLLDMVLSSLPEEALSLGTITQMQLNQKLDSLKGTLRHFTLIPAGGGGILTHAVAHIASSIKMREDESGDGIESLISKVEGLLVEGKVAEAADTLEGGVRGSEAEEVAVEWVRQARNRAVAEQALSLLQSYATSIAVS